MAELNKKKSKKKETEVKAKAKTETKAKAKTKTKAKAESKVKAKTKTESKVKVKAETKAKPKKEAKSESKAKSKTKSGKKPKSEAKEKSETKTKKQAGKKVVQSGLAFIQASFNNTIISLTDRDGNALEQGSPGRVGFKGSKRSTAFAATNAAMDVARRAMKKYQLKEVKVYIKGPGSGRNAAVKGLDSAGLKITQLADRTPIPHNGCRSRKPPRN